MYVKVANNTVVKQDPDYRKLIPSNVIVPANVTSNFLADLNIYEVQNTRPYNSTTQKLVGIAPTFDPTDLKWYGVKVEPLTPVDVITTKLMQLKANLEAKIAAGFVFEDQRYDIDNQAQLDMTSMKALFDAGVEDAHGGHWTNYYNQNIEMTAEKVQELFVAAGVWKATLIQSAQIMRVEIMALTNVSEIQAYDVSL